MRGCGKEVHRIRASRRPKLLHSKKEEAREERTSQNNNVLKERIIRADEFGCNSRVDDVRKKRSREREERSKEERKERPTDGHGLEKGG